MSWEVEDLNRRLLCARDAMDLAYAEPLDVRAVGAPSCGDANDSQGGSVQ